MPFSFSLRTAQNRHAQRGGTFLGLILGVLIGLFAALAVAVYVTKVPIPFAPKSSQNEGSVQDEIEKNKAWNPNAGLVGGKVDMGKTVEIPENAPDTSSDAAPEATPTPVKKKTPEAEAKPSPEPKPKASPEPKPKASPSPEAKASNDPLADLVKRKTAVQQGDVSTDEVVAKAEPFVYYVQIGAFVNRADADSKKAEAALSGFNASITEREQAGRQINRVRLGPFDSKDAADAAKTRLNSAGIDGALVRIQR
jgi:cell division protein FtsN